MVTFILNPFFYHLKELKDRFFYLFLTWFFSLISSCLEFDPILMHCVQPLNKIPLILTDFTEYWLTMLMTAFYFSFFVSFPMTLYQGWAFFSSSWFHQEKLYSLKKIIVSFCLFVIVPFLTFDFILPWMIQFFFLTQERTFLKCFPKLFFYMAFGLQVFSLLFMMSQFPILVQLFIKWGFIQSQILVKLRKSFLFFIFIFSAFISPPDFFSQFFLSGFFFLIYESIVFLSLLENK